MSHLQGVSSVAWVENANPNSYIGYWPGHIVAECLAEDEADTEPLRQKKPLPTKSRKNSESSFQRFAKKLSRTESESSLNNNNDINNNNKTIQSGDISKNDTDVIKAAKLLNKLKPGSAFSAIISSMVPFEILTRILKNENAKLKGVDGDLADGEFEEFMYDEFGFRVESVGGDENNDSQTFYDISLNQITSVQQLNEKLFIEDSKHKLKWIAYLEFTLNADIGQSFSWDDVTQLNRCEKLKHMIRGQGVPHSLRQFVWMRLSGALDKKTKSQFKYSELCKSHTHDQYHASKQIEKDLLRTLPTNACFSSGKSVGIPRLRRVLQAVAWLYPNIGYCQGKLIETIVYYRLVEKWITFKLEFY